MGRCGKVWGIPCCVRSMAQSASASAGLVSGVSSLARGGGVSPMMVPGQMGKSSM